MTKQLRVGCVQANPTLGDHVGNLEIVRAARAEFRGEADLVVFTECFLDGYPLGDLVSRPGFLSESRKAREDFIREIESDGGPAVMIGGVREGADRPYNAAFLIDTDGSVQVTMKCRLPNESVYDEKRTFAAGPMPTPFRFREWRIGIPICEDYWHGDVVRTLVDAGAELLVVPNSSHFRVGKQEARIKLARNYARQFQIPTLYLNQVCGQDETVFDGASFVVDRHGQVIVQAAAFSSASFLVVAARGDSGVEIQPRCHGALASPMIRPYPDDLEAMWSALVLGLRDYVRKCGNNQSPGVVLGMSGGLDSAMSAAVAVDALGADKVLLVRLPSKLTSKASMDDAAAAASLLRVRMETISIAPATESVEAMLTPTFEAFGRTDRNVTEENIQARARGLILMAISNKLGHMVLTTGNKSEMSVGYATLYGDMCGGFSVLKDVYKTEVFKLAEWRNKNRTEGALGPAGMVIPQAIIDKPPTAELAEGQTDEASLGPYRHLDAVLRHLIEGMQTAQMAASLASADLGEEISSDYARKVAKLVRGAQYKRRQSPPGVVVSPRDFGLDYRFPIAGKYEL